MNRVDAGQVHFIEGTELPLGSPAEANVADLIGQLLGALGEDTHREGLQRTPERVARMYQELLAGYSTDPAALINDAIFESDYAGVVLVRDIEFYSLCEHHMLPFYGKAHVAYVPDGRVLGLSKIPRAVDMFARRLQIQERMTQQIAEFLQDVLQPRGIAVIVEGSHLCGMMRGVKKSGTRMVTNTMLGVLKTDAAARNELVAQLQVSAATGQCSGCDAD